jgi:hypothetical protein
MSVSFYTHLLLGFHLTEDLCWTKTPYRGCSHDEVAGAKFCPECGAPTWKEEKYPLDTLDSDRFTIQANNTSDFQYAHENGAIAGLEIAIDRTTGSIDPPPHEEWASIEQDLRAVLASHGVSPSGPFGLHFARYVSY